MQPSQQTCCTAFVTCPVSSRSQAPESFTMSNFPFGSFGGQWRPVLSWASPPFTVPSLGPLPQVTDLAPASLISSAAPYISQPTDTPVPPPNPKMQTPADAEYAASTVRPAEGTQRQQQHLLRPAAPATTTKPQLSQPMSPAFVPNVSAAPQSMPIRISIGRVDVRAIMPAGPAKATVATRAKPALSLENYLKQREEGKR